MSNTIPLPEPVGIVWSDGMPHHTYVKGQLHAHAAAVSAAKDAEIAQLRADNTRLQNEVVMPLRERVRVLEDAIRHYEAALTAAWPQGAMGKSYEQWNAARIARAALEQTGHNAKLTGEAAGEV